MHSLAASSLLRPALLALGGSLTIAASAQIQVSIQPVPMTLQSLVVLLVGVAHGPRLGAATLLLYLAEGICGRPVFAGLRAGPAASCWASCRLPPLPPLPAGSPRRVGRAGCGAALRSSSWAMR